MSLFPGFFQVSIQDVGVDVFQQGSEIVFQNFRGRLALVGRRLIKVRVDLGHRLIAIKKQSVKEAFLGLGLLEPYLLFQKVPDEMAKVVAIGGIGVDEIRRFAEIHLAEIGFWKTAIEVEPEQAAIFFGIEIPLHPMCKEREPLLVVVEFAEALKIAGAAFDHSGIVQVDQKEDLRSRKKIT